MDKLHISGSVSSLLRYDVYKRLMKSSKTSSPYTTTTYVSIQNKPDYSKPFLIHTHSCQLPQPPAYMCHPHAIPKPQLRQYIKLSLPSFISQTQRRSLKKISQSWFRTKHNNNVVLHLFILINPHQTNNPILFIHHLYYLCNKQSISVTQKKAHMPPCISYSSPCPTRPARPVPDQEPTRVFSPSSRPL